VHILCEKPLTLSQSTFRSLHSYTLQHGRVVFTVHNWQYAPLFQALKAALVTGVVGMPEYLEFITLRARPAGLTSARVDSWRLDRQVAGGGILVDHGWHVFYLAPFLLGREPRAIAVRLERCRRAADSVEDTATGVIECSGARARFYLTWAAERRSNMGLVRGPAGMIRFDAAALRIEQPSKPVREQHFAEALTASSYHPEWFAPLLDDFQREIEDPRVRGRNLQAAALCLALTIRGYESYQQGGALLLL
jgi:predicted dehydrogenase